MKKYLFPLFTLLVFNASAQTETEIKKHYQDVNKQIAESIEHGYEGSLYCNEWVANKNSMSWPAVGNYNETTDFWYDDDPNHMSAAERNPKTVLLKVTVSRKASHLMTSEEWLYKNGKLVFYYLNEGEEGKHWETRIYFNSKGMFKSSVKADGKELTAKDFATEEYRDFKPNAVVILTGAKKYQELFVKSMGAQ